ncbi:MAG: hypothetical protein IJO85_09925 [Lachnospiraceae bacterium]|nr:hypothetical protein [Lachnospiraceae bacterium]
MSDELKERFQNPGSEFRSFPFWAWNDRMNPQMVREQVQHMKKAGNGGFFIHSRDGLETEYMGKEWMECVHEAIDTAKELGMYAWLYDEDRWPSGTAGGKVTALGEEYSCKGLTMEVSKERSSEKMLAEKNLVALYAARIDGQRIENFRRLSLEYTEEIAEEEEQLLIVRLEISAKSEWFNHQAPPDNLNPDTVSKFLKLTHEKYYEAVGEEFGKTIPGIFTDEPSLADRHAAFPANRGWIPWSYGMEAFFKERRGYDLLDMLPYHYFEGEHSRKIRHDYWYTITERYSEVYSGTLAKWCQKRGISYTGHFLQEDKLGTCTRVNGAVMPHYVYQDVPGIDILTEQTREYMTVKQCTSVAHQLGKKRTLTETYGCCGWDFILEGQKWIGDWQFVLGINTRTLHMALSTLRGCRKRDYPPSFHYNTSWIEKNPIVENYFARLGEVLSAGKPVRKVLLIHPASTGWCRFGTDPYGNPKRAKERDLPEVNAYGETFNQLIETLCREHMDCDLGDEILIKQYGFVNKNSIGIGTAEYKIVVLPRLDTLFESTCKLLIDFLNQGGCVVGLTPLPCMIEGDVKKRETLDKLLSHKGFVTVESEESLIAYLAEKEARTCRLLNQRGEEEKRLLALTVQVGDDTALFVVNNDRNAACEVDVIVPYKGWIEEWNLLNGKITDVVRDKSGSGAFHARWNKAGSRLFVIHGAKADTRLYTIPDIKTDLRRYINDVDRTSACLHALPKDKSRTQITTLPVQCEIQRNQPNVLVFDRCSYRLEDRKWSQEMEIWQVQREVREQLQMRPIHRNGIEQRYRWIEIEHNKNGTRLSLSMSFEVEHAEVGTVYLAMEQPERFEISLNGESVSNQPQGWFLDKAFQKLVLPKLKEGRNVLELVCAYENSMELENCYLLGDFGVTAERNIVTASKYLSVGSWTEQGFFHYCGSIDYCYDFMWEGKSRVELRLGEYRAICISVHIGDYTYEIPWDMGETIDITEALIKGENRIRIEVLGSPRNMLGPFHYKETYPKNTNDAVFSPDDEHYASEYHVVPYGLLETPQIIETM